MAHIGYGILYLFTSSRCLRLRLWHSLYTIPTPASTNNTATTRSNIQLLFDKAADAAKDRYEYLGKLAKLYE